MQRALRAVAACAIAGLALGPGACGGKPSEVAGPADGPDTLTIYSSLPLEGPGNESTRDMVRAIKLALQEAGGKVGPFSITYVPLDSATPEAGTWTRDKVLDNARLAVRDLNAIAYIGDRDSEATALALPMTNEGHVLQVSPWSTYDGLTRRSRRQGEPDRFYPSGLRTFGRMVPPDSVQAAALVGYMRDEGVRKLALLADRELYGGGLADELAGAGAKQGLEVVDLGRIDATKRDLSGEAAKAAASGADAFLFAGSVEEGAARLYTAVAAASPGMLLFGPAAVAEDSFARSLPAAVRRRMRVTSPALPAQELPPSALAFRARFSAAFGSQPAPEALHAYEAASAVLHAIRVAGDKGNDRRAVTEAFLAIRDRRSVLGTYSIDRFGDTSLSTYSGNRLGEMGLVLEKVLRADG